MKISFLDSIICDLTLEQGDNEYKKLTAKVSSSNSLAKLCGQSIAQSRPPAAKDFSVLASNMFLLGSVKKFTFAALIMLRLWDTRVNAVYSFASPETIERIARDILINSKLEKYSIRHDYANSLK